MVGLLAREAAASVGNADAAIHYIQGTWTEGPGEETSGACLWQQGKLHTVP